MRGSFEKENQHLRTLRDQNFTLVYAIITTELLYTDFT